ncbi:hypothetical protein LZ518_05640 [Sphingomonas sp. RB56-2]|uniref:Uncharacterized protein n=1 Tax=Sphingomonas brevis TaxID=2908206 RepID=A0ABT0S890_9SPHN|nr:hypothetical protein [Sphingomonas brevis]MCL6740614.1 hypothetical protein [Sphingomonas brevis]
MKRVTILLAAGAATLAVAVPAAAQSPYAYPQQTYPQQTYPQGQYYPQQGYGYPGQIQGQDGITQIIGQLLGNRYQTNDRVAVERCATAAMAQANAQYRRSPYAQGYGDPRGGYGNQGYYPASSMRVTAITDVRRRNNGLRVSGLLDSSFDGHPPYGNAYGYQGQGYQGQRYAGQGDLTFRCNVAYNGAVTGVRVGRNQSAYNGAYNRGY